MRLSAIDALHRGVLAALANWPVVLVQLLVYAVALALFLGGLLPPLVVLGATAAAFALLRPGASDPSALGELFGQLVDRAGGVILPLLLASLATMILWFLSFLVYSWGFAGGLGVLAAAERQAPRRAGEVAVFRTWSWRLFSEAGSQGLWRAFWFLNLGGGLVLLPVMIGLGLLLPVGLFAANEQLAAAAAVGCGGFLLLLPVFLLLCAWVGVAVGDLPRRDGGAVAALGTGWRVLWRRLGAVLLIYLIYVAVASGVGGVAFGFQLIAEMAGQQSTFVGLVLWGGVSVLQGAVSGLLSLVISAVMIALVADTRRAELVATASPDAGPLAVQGGEPFSPPSVPRSEPVLLVDGSPLVADSPRLAADDTSEAVAPAEPAAPAAPDESTEPAEPAGQTESTLPEAGPRRPLLPTEPAGDEPQR